MSDYLTQLLTADKQSLIQGEIYKIVNLTNGKIYVGQTLTHRLNKGKYRPFGYIGRFYDHISEALNNTKKKQCWYLNNAIRSSGREYFEVHLIERCSPKKLDDREQAHIVNEHSLYPNGYNLTPGGKTFSQIGGDTNVSLQAKKRGGCTHRLPETREKISQRLKEHVITVDKEILSRRVIEQHDKRRFQKFKHCNIDAVDLSKYITETSTGYNVKVGTLETGFTSVRQTKQEMYDRAMQFLTKISQDSNVAKLTGTP